MSDTRTGAERIADERQRQLTSAAPCGECDASGTLDGSTRCHACGGSGEAGWTPDHDDGHFCGELAMAAVCYAAPGRVYVRRSTAVGLHFVDPWPFSPRWDKRPYDGNVLEKHPSPGQRIRMLEKAGALVAAEIDRLLRMGK